MRELLKDLSLSQGRGLGDFEDLAAAVQKERYDNNSARTLHVSRSTALVAIGELDREVFSMLDRAGLDWDLFRQRLGIKVLPVPIDGSDVVLADKFKQSIETLHGRLPDAGSLGLREIAAAILQSVASDEDSGRLPVHLEQSGLDGEAVRVVLANPELGWDVGLKADFVTDEPIGRDFLGRNFFGRDVEMAQITSLLQAAPRGDGPVTVVVTGPAGMGKTSLARVAVERVSNDFDKVVWLSGRELELDSAGALRTAWEQIDLPADSAGLPLEELIPAYQSAIANKNLLVVIDDAGFLAESTLSQLVPQGSQSAALVTTRPGDALDPLVQRTGATIIELGPLAPEDTRSVFSDAGLDDEAISEVIVATDGWSVSELRILESTLYEARPDPASVEDLVASAKRRLAAAERAGELDPGSAFDLAARAVSDLPTGEDLLGFKPLVDALDRLLSNKDTQLPLAIGVTAPWGSGKSSLMRQLEGRLKDDVGRPLTGRSKSANSSSHGKGLDRAWSTVWFDAWKYERGERIWAGLTKAIYQQSQDGLPSGWQRLKFRVRLEHSRRGRYGFWVKLLAPLLITLAAVAIAFLAESPIAAGVSIVAGLSVAASTLGRYWGLMSEPFRRAIDAHVAQRDFDDQLGLTFKANEEIAALARVLTPPVGHKGKSRLRQAMQRRRGKKQTNGSLGSQPEKENSGRPSTNRAVAIFVDDLDRCRTDQIVETLEAINQIFNADDERQFAFILGMDQEVVAASLDHAYRDVIERLGDRDPTRVRRFGERFLAKIVQLSVVVPEPEPHAMRRLLAEITGNEPPEEVQLDRPTNLEPDDELVTQLYDQLAEAENPAAVYEMAEKLLEDLAAGQQGATENEPTERALQEAIRKRRAETLSHDASDVVEAEFAALEVMGRNPRALKRFDNAFRLQLYVANATPGVPPELFNREHLTALAKWMALAVDHPEAASALRSEPSLLAKVEAAADGSDGSTKLPAELADRDILAYFETGTGEIPISDLPFATFLQIV